MQILGVRAHDGVVAGGTMQSTATVAMISEIVIHAVPDPPHPEWSLGGGMAVIPQGRHEAVEARREALEPDSSRAR
jgi:hypothetical protein